MILNSNLNFICEKNPSNFVSVKNILLDYSIRIIYKLALHVHAMHEKTKKYFKLNK